MAVIGSSNTIVTLTPADRNTTFTGTIDAYGTIKPNDVTQDAAVYGPVGTDFTLLNTGLIESVNKVGVFATGVVLDAPGTIKNTGSIIDDGGVSILGTAAGADIYNAMLIQATGGYGIYVEGNATIVNAGLVLSAVSAGDAGILLERDGGSVTNTGTITGADGINFFDFKSTGVPTAYVHNTGTITAYDTRSGGYNGLDAGNFYHYGVAIYSIIAGEVVNAGIISANKIAIAFSISAATILNRGIIEDSAGDGVYLAAGGTVTNSGLINVPGAQRNINSHHQTFISTGIIILGGGTIENATSGTILAANGIGIELDNTNTTPKPGAVVNAGTILAASGIEFDAKGTMTNTGVIIATDHGFVAEDPVGIGVNKGLIEATAASFVYNATTYTAAAVNLQQGGSFRNEAAGRVIAAAGDAVLVNAKGSVSNAGTIDGGNGIVFNETTAASAFVANAGLIEAYSTVDVTGNFYNAFVRYGVGVYANAAGSIDNTGTIAGNHVGIVFNGPVSDKGGRVYNYGDISGQTGIYGVYTTIDNFHGGTITGTSYGVQFNGDGYVYNAGLITGTCGVLLPGGNVTNFGTVTGTSIAIGNGPDSVPITIINDGVISETSTSGTAIQTIFGLTLTNQSSGTISGGNGLYVGNGPANITNAGLISVDGLAIELRLGGLVTNTGTISGGSGISDPTSPGLIIDNAGLIRATGTRGDAIVLGLGGYVTNAAGGTIVTAYQGSGIALYGRGAAYNDGSINAGQFGILLAGNGGVALNYAVISASTFGIDSRASNDAVYNLAGGTVTAGNTGVLLQAAGYVYNDGLITADSVALELRLGGTVNNAGTIDGHVGVSLAAGGTLIESGKLVGAAYAAYFEAGHTATSRLILSPKAVINGTVNLNGAALELAADGKKIGTFAPESQQFLNAGSITVDSKAIWDFAGTFTNGSTSVFTNDGTIEAGKGLLSFNGPIIGTGLIEIGKKILTIDSTVAATQKLVFTGTAETLALGDPQDVAAKIEDFSIGDTIDLENFADSNIRTYFAKGILTLTNDTASLTLTFANPASFGIDIFGLTGAGPDSTLTLVKSKAAIVTPTSQTESPTSLPDLATVYAAPTQTNAAALSAMAMSMPGSGWLQAADAPRLAPIPLLTLHP
jgi:hypothetical protein